MPKATDGVERLYTCEVTARKARAVGIALRDWIGSDDVQEALGNGDQEMVELIREVIADLDEIRSAEDKHQRFRTRFREILRLEPKLPSRIARERAEQEIGS